MSLLIFIHLPTKAPPKRCLIVTQDPCFLKPREPAKPATSYAIEHAVASAALAASF
jgi:hypothetical protein